MTLAGAAPPGGRRAAAREEVAARAGDDPGVRGGGAPVVVGEVSEGMPAEGVVQSGDVILAVNGEETSNFAALKEATVGHLDEITYTVERDG